MANRTIRLVLNGKKDLPRISINKKVYFKVYLYKEVNGQLIIDRSHCLDCYGTIIGINSHGHSTIKVQEATDSNPTKPIMIDLGPTPTSLAEYLTRERMIIRAKPDLQSERDRSLAVTIIQTSSPS